MQKIICTVILILFSLIPSRITATKFYINYNNIKMTEQEYNNLLNLGFNKVEISHMNKDEFINNKDIKATLMNEKEQYYETSTIIKNGVLYYSDRIIEEEQFKIQKSNPSKKYSGYDGIVKTEYKHIRTSIIKIDAYQYRYKVTLTWLKIPKIRSYDIIGIGLQPAYVQINSSIYAQQNYTTKNGKNFNLITCIPLEDNNGGSAILKLPTGSIKSLSSYLYYNVKKANDNNTITHMNAGGDYAHAVSNVNKSIATKHSINHSSGIELKHSIKKYYDGINVATASWHGEW